MKKSLLLTLTAGTSLFATPYKLPEQQATLPKNLPSDSESEAYLEPGMPMQKDQSQPAFSQSARFETGDSWDCTFQAAFTYLYASQDNMEVALPFLDVDTPTELERTIVQKFEYQPGFEVGIMANTPYDKWVLGAGYLWYRSNTSTSRSAETDVGFHPAWFAGADLNDFKSKWHLGIDQVDLYASRPFYLGQRLTINPYVGLKSNWIRQNFTITGLQFGDLDATITSNAKSHAWGIGPEAGMQTNFLLGNGFAFFGNIGASLLYTDYTTLGVTTTYSASTFDVRENNYKALRTNLDSGLGIEWGTYLNNQAYFLHFSAEYKFSAFFNQNMIHSIGQFVNFPSVATTNAGNLYLSGLTVSAFLLF